MHCFILLPFLKQKDLITSIFRFRPRPVCVSCYKRIKLGWESNVRASFDYINDFNKIFNFHNRNDLKMGINKLIKQDINNYFGYSGILEIKPFVKQGCDSYLYLWQCEKDNEVHYTNLLRPHEQND